jgi:hypothetical protein
VEEIPDAVTEFELDSKRTRRMKAGKCSQAIKIDILRTSFISVFTFDIRFGAIKAVKMKVLAFCNLTPFSLV